VLIVVGSAEEVDRILCFLEMLGEEDGQHGLALAWATSNPEQSCVPTQQRSILAIILNLFTSTFGPISFHTDKRSSVVFGRNRQEGILTGFDLLFWCEWCGCDVQYLRMRVVLSVACTRLVMVVLLTRS
jgi:hypothetical protein